ncbi:hypothetical protein SATMO3_36550 [Sporomusa aerivorans]
MDKSEINLLIIFSVDLMILTPDSVNYTIYCIQPECNKDRINKV